jgi:HlyD family secretion protein
LDRVDLTPDLTHAQMNEPAPIPEPPPRREAMDRPVARSRWKARRPWIALAAAVIVATGLGLWLIPPPGSLSVKVAEIEAAAVQRAPFQDYLPVRAEVAPLRTVFLGAISGGQVEKVLQLDGAQVAAGDALATLTNPELKLDVTSKEAEIAGRLGDTSAQELALERNRLDGEKEVSETNYSLLTAERDLDIRQRLHEQGFASDAEVKTFATQAAYYRNRLKDLKSGQAREDSIAHAQAAQIAQTDQSLRSNLGVVRSSLDALVIRAPVAGRLTDFILQPGQSLKAGDPVGQIDSEGAYKLTADVDEFYLGRVAPGQRAVADVDGNTAPLSVSRVLPQVTNGRFRVELTFDRAPPTALRRGQALDIRITLGDTRPALIAPNGAWLDGSGGTYAFVMANDGRRATRRPITIGRRNPEQVEITSGLRPGERVVTSSYAGFDKFSHLILH